MPDRDDSPGAPPAAGEVTRLLAAARAGESGASERLFELVYDDLRVWEYLDFFARCYDVPARRRPAMIGELLEIVGLTDKREAYVESLSRGMRQRLCLAHTLVHDPALLILDEPASGLDPRARVEMREILRELRGMGKTILVSSHILPELGEMCTGVAIIDHGRVLRAGSIGEIERSLRASALLRVDVVGDADAVAAAAAWLGTDPRISDVLPTQDVDGTTRLEAAFDGGTAEQADLLRRMIEAGHVVAGFAQATSDLEEIFLKVTGQVVDEAEEARARAAVFLEGQRRRLMAPALACGWLRARRSAFAALTR